VAAVLSGFPQQVVEYVTDPRTGLPSIERWLPSVADVKQACLKRQAYLDKLKDLDRRFGGRSPIALERPRNRKLAGCRANVFVPADAPQYQRCLDLCKTADRFDWRMEDGPRRGIWIALELLYSCGSVSSWKQPLMADAPSAPKAMPAHPEPAHV